MDNSISLGVDFLFPSFFHHCGIYIYMFSTIGIWNISHNLLIRHKLHWALVSRMNVILLSTKRSLESPQWTKDQASTHQGPNKIAMLFPVKLRLVQQMRTVTYDRTLAWIIARAYVSDPTALQAQQTSKSKKSDNSNRAEGFTIQLRVYFCR